jgi:hypothetical protein
MTAPPYVEVTARGGVFRNLLAQKGNHMRIAAPSALLPRVAAATSGGGCAPAVAALTPNKAGQLTPAATHPTPPVSGRTRPLRIFDARLLHLVGDNKLGVSRGSGLAANAAVDRKAPPASERPSAISAVAASSALSSPATSIPVPSTRVRETVAIRVSTGNEMLRLQSSS